jgi:hypothetical protein
VPLGETGNLRTKVVNPLMLPLERHPKWSDRDRWPDFAEAAHAQMDRFLRPFDVGVGAGRIDVAVKKQNTANLLEAAHKHSWRCLQAAALGARIMKQETDE